MLFLFKIAVPPILVAAMSLVARWWGPTVGGLLMGIPWMTGPVLYFLTADKGETFGVAACVGIELGVVCICAFMLAWGAASAIAGWPFCLPVAAAAFGLAAWALQETPLPLWAASATAWASLLLTYPLLPRPLTPSAQAALPWWDIPARMAVTFGLVAVIMTTADILGPQLSGIVSTYPVILSVIGAFTHHQWGRDAVRRVLRGLTLSLLGFVAFFLVVGTTLPAVGLTVSFLLAAAAAITASAALLLANRLRLIS